MSKTSCVPHDDSGEKQRDAELDLINSVHANDIC